MANKHIRLSVSQTRKVRLFNAYCWYLGGCVKVLRRIEKHLSVPTRAEVEVIENLIRRMRRYYRATLK